MKATGFLLATAFAAAALTAGLRAEAAPPDWAALGREMEGAGEHVRAGESPETGVWILAEASVAAGVGGSGAERVALARLEAKRALAGFIAGERVSAEEVSVSEETADDAGSSFSESFRRRIETRADAFLRGVQDVVAEETPSGGARAVLVATERTADASAALAAASAGAGAGTVRACGFGAVPPGEGGLAVARAQALAAAKASAVEMVLGASVSASGAALDMAATARVFASAGGFVRTYRVEAEGEVGGGSYRVAILAEVDRGGLQASYEAALAAMGDLRFFVEPTGDRALDTALAEKFAAWGCPVTTDRASASYLVRCTGAWTPVVHPADGREGWRLSCSVRVLDAATGSELLSASNDPSRAVDFAGSDAARKRDRATEKAMRDLHGRLHEGLDRMVGRMAATGREVRLVFENYSPSFEKTLDGIVACVGRVPGCQAPSLRVDATAATATLTLRCQLDMDALRRFVSAEMERSVPASSRPDSVSFDANTWTLSW